MSLSSSADKKLIKMTKEVADAHIKENESSITEIYRFDSDLYTKYVSLDDIYAD